MNKPATIFKDYSSHRPYFLAFVRTLEISHFLRSSPLKGNVLDFGCGDGFFLQMLAKYYPQLFKNSKIIGLDLSKYKNKIYHSTVSYDGKVLPFKTKSIDNIISNCVFEHVPNLELSVNELYRILKPNGIMVCTVMSNYWNDYCRLPNWFWDKAQVHHNLYTQEKWQQTFEKAGFKVKIVKGYLNKRQSQFVEIGHFLSLPYLVSKLIFNKWHYFNFLYKPLQHSKKVEELLNEKVDSKNPAGLYFELRKK